jgi:hypothetical protein
MPRARVVEGRDPSSVRWPDEQAGPWEVTLDWRQAEDGIECIGVAIKALDPVTAPNITASLMRKLPIVRLIARVRRERYEREGGAVIEALDSGQDLDLDEDEAGQLRASSDPWAERRRGRPTELGHDHYRDVAIVYSAALAANAPPLRAVEKRWQVSRPTASRWVAAARSAGLLPPTEQGRAKGDVSYLSKEADPV